MLRKKEGIDIVQEIGGIKSKEAAMHVFESKAAIHQLRF